ncbi:MAG: hypothetical protein WKF58_06340 [Ilumatobacteraceae bacterium]
MRRRDADDHRDRRPPRHGRIVISDRDYRALTDVRVHEPGTVADALAARRRRDQLTRAGMLFVVAADHTARGWSALGDELRAMADRRSMLERILTALAHPRADGVLASADIIEDLVLLGALDDRAAVGTMNRGGLAGASWELDDRFTAYDADHLVAANLDAGKMLLRLDLADERTLPTLDACSDAVQALHDHELMAMVEPIPARRDPSGALIWDADPERLLQAVGRLRRARWLVGAHVAEDPGDGRHRRGGGDDDAAAAAPRRRAGA